MYDVRWLVSAVQCWCKIWFFCVITQKNRARVFNGTVRQQSSGPKDIVLDKDLTHGQVRKVDMTWAEKLAAGFMKDRPGMLELTVWKEQGVSLLLCCLCCAATFLRILPLGLGFCVITHCLSDTRVV